MYSTQIRIPRDYDITLNSLTQQRWTLLFTTQSNISKAVASLASVSMIYKSHQIEFEQINSAMWGLRKRTEKAWIIEKDNLSKVEELNKALQDSLRNGIIASAYPIPFRGEPYFLVDSNLEEGVSGSPVITKFKDTWRTKNGSKPLIGFSFFLLGIISSTFEVPEVEKPVGLNATYFAGIIDQITSLGRQVP